MPRQVAPDVSIVLSEVLQEAIICADCRLHIYMCILSIFREDDNILVFCLQLSYPKMQLI